MDLQQVEPATIDHLRGAIKTFGRELFAYCLDSDEPSIEAIENDINAISARLQPIVADMVYTLTQIKLHSAISDTPLEILISHIPLAEFNGAESSIFNVWRARSGGDTPDFRTGDPVMEALAQDLSNAYPLTIILRHFTGAPWRLTSTPDLSASLGRMQSFGEAVLADPKLSRLFPGHASMGMDTASYFVSNTGRAGDLQLAVMSSAIFKGAYSMFRFRQQTSAADLRDAVATTVALLRSLASGDAVPVPAWIGMGNVSLPMDNVKLPWGTLRQYPYPTHLELIPPEARPSTTTDEGGDVRTLGVILETIFVAQLITVEPPASATTDPTWPSTMAREFAKLDEHFGHTSLAAMLATERNPPAACTRLWTAIFDPLSFGSHLSFKTDANPPVSFHIFSPSEVESMQKWADTLRSTSVRNFGIPQRRILSAVAERKDPVDGFIDAIVAWESLFAGTDQGELSFRICAAMATLLHESESERLAEHKRLNKLYNKRSKVLHGAREITPADAIESRDYAVRAVLECVRKLYLEHPEMLQDPDRSRTIILSL